MPVIYISAVTGESDVGKDFYKNWEFFPCCIIILTNKDKKELLNLPDTFADMIQGTSPNQASTSQS